MKKLTFNETLALQLYYQCKSDKEIGEAVGKSSDTIASWRNRRKLPSLTVNPRTNESYVSRCDFHNVLSPRQSKEMERFLRYLSWANRKFVEVGMIPDIGRFMEIWKESA